TAHIETITAVFQMEEILFELREHCAGLEAAGWDYLFSVVKNLRNTSDYVLPDRERLTLDLQLMKAFTDSLDASCHRRGANANGSISHLMSDHPDEIIGPAEHASMRDDKARAVWQGFHRTRVADPAQVPPAMAAFDAALGPRPHQQKNKRPDAQNT